MRQTHWLKISLIIAVFLGRSGYAAVVDVTDSPHWAQLCENGVTLRWDKSWVSDAAVAAQLSISGMSVRVSEALDPDAGTYAWTVQLGDAEEDVCEVRLSFLDAQGSSLGVLEARLAVSESAFGQADVRAGDDPDWQKVKKNVLIPWNAAWLGSSDSCERMGLQWTNAQTGSLSSAETFGFYPLSSSGRPKGQYDFTLSFFDGDDEVVDEPFLATIFLMARGTLFSIR